MTTIFGLATEVTQHTRSPEAQFGTKLIRTRKHQIDTLIVLLLLLLLQPERDRERECEQHLCYL